MTVLWIAIGLIIYIIQWYISFRLYVASTPKQLAHDDMLGLAAVLSLFPIAGLGAAICVFFMREEDSRYPRTKKIHVHNLLRKVARIDD